MITSGHMNYFSVKECGLYRSGEEKNYGLEMAETFQSIANWVGTNPMADTIPWDPATRTSASKCYCHDIYKSDDSGDFLFVLWKSDTDRNGSLWGAPEAKSAGKGKVIEYTNSYKGEKVIWGRPCYYWIIPSLNAVVSIKFDHSVCDSQLFQEWVSACITSRVKHSNKIKDQTEHGYARLYFTDGTHQSSMRFRYGFDMGLMSLDSKDGTLVNLASKITHIIRRETLIFNKNDERSEWVKKFSDLPFIGTRDKGERTSKRQIEIKAEARPTSAQVQNIIEQFARESRRPSDWDNVGFATESETIWVDRYRLRNSVEYNYSKTGVIPAMDLYDRLNKNREAYLGAIVRSQENKSSKAKRGVAKKIGTQIGQSK